MLEMFYRYTFLRFLLEKIVKIILKQFIRTLSKFYGAEEI